MSSVDRLIKKYAPEGVAYRTLGDIARTIPGLSGKTKTDFSEGNARYVSYKNAFANPSVDLHAADFVKVAPTERQNELRLGDVVITGSSENSEDVGMSSVVVQEPSESLYLNSFCFAVRFDDPDLLLPDFSKHLFRGHFVRSQIRRSASGVTRINISKPRFLKTLLPVPPLDVQREIVRVLDSFADLEASLEAEIGQRRQLAEPLLRVRSGSLHNKPSSRAQRVSTFARQYIQPVRVEQDSEYVNLGVKWYGEGVFARAAKPGSSIAAKTLYGVQAGQFIYNRMFVTEGSFGTVPSELANGVVSNEFPVFDIDQSIVLPEWLHLYFRDPFVVSQVARQAEGGTKSRRRWKEEQFLDFEIELPDLEEQKRVVGLARAFDELNDQLRAELAARRKQYYYYRDKLLSFEEAS